ncbi:MAG: ATP-binding protein [Phycisphaerae bacterium]|jgi:serine/threonine-protein kinase RsbW
MVIPSDLRAAHKLALELLGIVNRCGYEESCAFAIRLALEEALSNAIRHGNQMNPAKAVEVEYDIDPRRAIITVTDQGEGFNPAVVPDPTIDENLEKPSGRGIMLMRAYMDEVCFNNRGNQVRLVKQNH